MNSIGHLGWLSCISNFLRFHKNVNSLELWKYISENSSPKGSFWRNKRKSEFSELSWDSPYLQPMAYEVRSETKLAFGVVESLFRFVSLCTEFVSSTSDHLVVNWAYSSRRLPRSSRRRRVRLVDSPDRPVVIRLVATEFVSSTRETDSSRITPLRLVKCRVRLVELWDRLVVSW